MLAGKKILLLEDDHESMIDLKEHLEDEGSLVEMTASEELFSRLRRDRFDLILLDMMIQPITEDPEGRIIHNIHYDTVLWKKTGLEFLRRFRAGEYSNPDGQGTPANLPVILLSAVADSSCEETKPSSSLADYYVEKPFRLAVLVSQIEEALKK